ncbi:MAG: hypothetical protein JWO58_2233 [Chitinophagaceae bacterium]|nr:hypothetical protein [Chitinophagaceae bacterium]
MLSLVLGFHGRIVAQSNPWKVDRYTSFGLALQGSYFYGDVSGGLRTTRPGFEFSVVQKITSHSSVGLSAGWIRLLGSDYLNASLYNSTQQDNAVRNLHFRSDVVSLQGFYQYDLFPSYKDYIRRPLYNIFFKGGLGVFHFEPKTKDSTGAWINLRPLETEGKSYSAYSAMIPLSLGVRYKISYHFDFEVEFSYVYTFTDYLDDVSGDYPNVDPNKGSSYFTFRSTQKNDPQTGKPRDLNYMQNQLGYTAVQNGDASYFKNHGPGTSRGSRPGFDSYMVVSFRLVYLIPHHRINCPRY